MLYILDTSSILSGIFFEGRKATTPGVIGEIKPGGHSWRLLEFMRNSGLEIISPPEEALEEVKKAAKRTGDYANLSEVDMEVIALAYYKKGLLLTDDYSMQNVARELGLDYKGIMEEGIKEKFYWIYRCRDCGKIFEEFYEECPVCGGVLKRTRKVK